jgi:predicted dehydrogenase
VQSIATGEPQGATVENALRAAEIIEAMAESARSRRWLTVS